MRILSKRDSLRIRFFGLAVQLAGAVEHTNCISCWGGGGFKILTNECPDYDIKPVNGEAPVMLQLWGMRSSLSLSLLPGPLLLGMLALDRVLSMGQIEL